MDEHLSRKRSAIRDDGCPRGCMGGLLQFLDFNQRLHVRKLLVYHRRSGDGRRHGRSRSPKAKQNVTADEENPPDEDESIMVEDARRISRCDSNKVLKRSINSNRRHSEHDLTQSTSPQNMHLLRTYSIHHLDSIDYADNQTHAENHQTKLYNKIPEHVLEKHKLLREKLIQAKESLSKKKSVDLNEIEQDSEFQQSKEFMDMLVLFNNNRELLLKVLKHPDVFVRFLDTRRDEAMAQKFDDDTIAKENVTDESSSKENRSNLSHFKIIKKRIKDVINENNKEGLRISMDGFLHKIPYGSKLSNNEMKEKKGILERENSRNKGIKRSHSLNESLDKYSRLLETISSIDAKTNTEKLKLESKKKAAGKTLGRIFSLPDFDSSSLRKDDQCAFHMGQSLKIPISVDIYDKNEPKSVDASVDSADSIVEEENLLPNIESNSPENLDDAEIFSAPGSLDIEEELDSSPYNKTQLDTSFPDQIENTLADSDLLQVSSELDHYYNFFNLQIGTKFESQFNYVRDILWKSGFGTEEFLKAWYSPNQPIDPIIFEESETFQENQLLFDLINEVILEIYDSSSSCCPWLSRFDMHTRPVPLGHHVLEEVWENVNWYLSSQFYEYDTLELGIANDFSKKDGWMEILYDIEDVGLVLEDCILDGLLDEFVLELIDE